MHVCYPIRMLHISCLSICRTSSHSQSAYVCSFMQLCCTATASSSFSPWHFQFGYRQQTLEWAFHSVDLNLFKV